MAKNDTILGIVPSLVSLFINAEEKKGSELTEEEVLKIRDESECIAMPHSKIEPIYEF